MEVTSIINTAQFLEYLPSKKQWIPTQVRTEAQNLGIGCSISFFLRLYYGNLHAYTAEVLPSAHHTTGNGIAMAFNRFGGIMRFMSAVIAGAVNTTTSIPIWDCFALFGGLVLTALFPFEHYGKEVLDLSIFAALNMPATLRQQKVALLLLYDSRQRHCMLLQPPQM